MSKFEIMNTASDDAAGSTNIYPHYTVFGAGQQPAVADQEGFLALREGFQALDEADMTAAEKWATDRIASIDEFRARS